MKVYAVSFGRWSDYYIREIFSSEEAAKKAAEADHSKHLESYNRLVTYRKKKVPCEDCGSVEEYVVDGGPRV